MLICAFQEPAATVLQHQEPFFGGHSAYTYDVFRST